jgi:uncharacterized membrane protein YjdF
MAAKNRPIQEGNEQDEKRYNRFVEEAKFKHDYLKHVATLDTGSIVLMATFLQKSDSRGQGKLLAFSAACFFISIICVVAVQNLLAHHLANAVDDIKMLPTEKQKCQYNSSMIIAYLGFVSGLALLAAFVYGNLEII